ncbi:MAG: hypothetical protein Q9199_005115, partial [Rusavskia elegans]
HALKKALDEDPFWGPHVWRTFESRAKALERGIEELVEQSIEFGSLAAANIAAADGNDDSPPTSPKHGILKLPQTSGTQGQRNWMPGVVMGCWTTLLADAAEAKRIRSSSDGTAFHPLLTKEQNNKVIIHLTSISTPLPSPSLVPLTQNGTPTPHHLSGPVDTWTVEREARLLYVQRQLKAAQAAWSEEQELWIDEVGSCRFRFSLIFRGGGSLLLIVIPYTLDNWREVGGPSVGSVRMGTVWRDIQARSRGIEVHQLEDLKRICLKKEKKAKRRANSVAKMWKAKTWGSAAGLKGSEGEALGESSPAFVAEPEGMVGDDAVDGDCDEEEDEEHSSSPRNTKSLTTLFRTISFGNNDRSSQGQSSRRNTLDGGLVSRRPSVPTTPEGSCERKGKRNLLMKRRGSGQ